MKRHLARSAARSGGAAVLLTAALAAGCASEGPGAAGRPQIGIDIPRADSDFWRAYAKYLRLEIDEQRLSTLPVTESHGDDTVFEANVRSLINRRPRSVVMAPQNTLTTDATLARLFNANIDTISVDTRPEYGIVYMVVRTDNRSYGTKSCEYLGKQLGSKGKVAVLQGSLDSINGYERSDAFARCMKQNFPRIEVIELATEWNAGVASAKLQSTLTAHPDLGGIYMQAGGVFLQPTLDLLRQKGRLKPAGQSGHLTVVSNDGTPAELEAIRRGDIDATVSQPADLYAKYALYYAKAAAEGRTFQPGPTDHGSTIVTLPNGLEDQLPAPLVTKENVDNGALWGNNLNT